MAVIYDFCEYRAPRLLRSFSQQAGELVENIYELDRRLQKLSDGLRRVQEAHHTFSSQLDIHLSKLERSRRFAHTCSDAYHLGTTELMIEKRDQIIRNSLS